MNTTRTALATSTSTSTSTNTNTSSTTLHSTTSARIQAFAMASLLTTAMLLGVNTLATVDAGSAQMAQQTAPAGA